MIFPLIPLPYLAFLVDCDSTLSERFLVSILGLSPFLFIKKEKIFVSFIFFEKNVYSKLALVFVSLI